MKTEINISFGSEIWFDLTNDRVIGDSLDLIQYVDKYRLIVKNQDCFVLYNKFWYNIEPRWIKFEDKKPTDKLGEQVRVLLGHPGWATYVVGMYACYKPEEILRERISEYKASIDRYCEWDRMMPTHWYKLPENPEK